MGKGLCSLDEQLRIMWKANRLSVLWSLLIAIRLTVLISDEFVICKLKKFRRARLIRIINHYNYHFALWRRFRITDFHCFCIILLLIYEIAVFINKQFCIFYCSSFYSLITSISFLLISNLFYQIFQAWLSPSLLGGVFVKNVAKHSFTPIFKFKKISKKILRLLEIVVWKRSLIKKKLTQLIKFIVLILESFFLIEKTKCFCV